MKVTNVTTLIINSAWPNLVFVRIHTNTGVIGTGAPGTEGAARF